MQTLTGAQGCALRVSAWVVCVPDPPFLGPQLGGKVSEPWTRVWTAENPYPGGSWRWDTPTCSTVPLNSLAKYKFRDKTSKNFKTVTAGH